MSEVKFDVSVDVLSKVKKYLYTKPYGEVKGYVNTLETSEVNEENVTVVKLSKTDAEDVLDYLCDQKYREVSALISEFKTDISLHIQVKEAAAKEKKNEDKSKKAS